MAIKIEDIIPGIKENGLNCSKAVDFSGSSSVALPAGTTLASASALTLPTIVGGLTASGSVANDFSGSTGAFKTSTGAVTIGAGAISISGAVTFAADKGIAYTSGTGAADFSNGSGVFKTTTGTVTIGTGAVTVSGNVASSGNVTFDYSGSSGTFKTSTGVNTLGGATNVSGAVTITSTSASALVAGRQGATNPVLQVDASTATVLTGMLVKGAGTGAGLALSVVETGGTNNALTIDAMGSGVVNLGSVSTGMVIASRGAHKVLVNNGLLTALGTVQNSTPSAAQTVGGFLSQNSTSAGGTVTFDNGTNISAQVPNAAVGDSFTCVFANIGNQTLTFTSATGATLVGTAALAAGKNATLYFVNTGSNAWNVYSNVSA